MKKHVFLIFFVILFSSSFSKAEGVLTNTKLYLNCKHALVDNTLNPQGVVDQNYCYGYSSGFLQAMNIVQNSLKKRAICTPQTTSFMIAKMYVDYIDKNPIKLSDSTDKVFAEFLMDSFPCKE